MPTSLDLTAWSGEAGGYHLVRGLFLPAHSLGAVEKPRRDERLRTLAWIGRAARWERV